MPGPPRPLKLVAARDFTYRQHAYRNGDPITDPSVINQLSKYGRRYLRAAKPATAEPPAEDSATQPEPESPKED